MIPLPTGVTTYALVAAGVAVVGALGYAGYQHQRAKAAEFELVAYKAQAEAESEKLRAKAAEVKVQVVTEYRDRVKEIRVPTPVEVVREIEVIRQSGCMLPPSFRVLHDAATDADGQTPAGVDDTIAHVECATAIEVIRENYARFRENAAQLEALQKWAASVSADP